ncbi:MAG TPA: hypothetical protein ENJ82_09335, partial [Bacteroidetes bacterium]|nr:hypothetical protein [Bacteroidota bacterium]
MKRNNTLLLFIFIASFLQVQAQTKSLTLEQAVLQGRTTLAPTNIRNLSWIPETDKFGYVKEVS